MYPKPNNYPKKVTGKKEKPFKTPPATMSQTSTDKGTGAEPVPAPNQGGPQPPSRGPSGAGTSAGSDDGGKRPRPKLNTNLDTTYICKNRNSAENPRNSWENPWHSNDNDGNS